MRGRWPSSTRLWAEDCASVEVAQLPRPFQAPEPEFVRLRKLAEPRRELPQVARFTATWSDGRDSRHVVELVMTRPHFGGVRYWFLCPRCERRVGKLYGPCVGSLGCRGCLHLAYLSQYSKWPRRAACPQSAAAILSMLVRQRAHPIRVPRYLRIEEVERQQDVRAARALSQVTGATLAPLSTATASRRQPSRLCTPGTRLAMP
jgi:hypothetical protein